MVTEPNFDEMSGIWSQRFKFFHKYGFPMSGTSETRAALKDLPFWARSRITINGVALFFGALWFFAKGIWRKGLVLLIANVVVAVPMIVFDTPDWADRMVSFGFLIASGLLANPAYYLHVVHQSRSWNPFEEVDFAANRSP